MKKIIVLLGFLFLVNASFASNAVIRETAPASRPNNSYNPNSVFNVRQQIEAQQQTIRSKYFDKMVPSQAQSTQKPLPPPPPPNGHRPPKHNYIPHTYGMEYVNKKEEPKQEVIINNTYNYYNTPEDKKPEIKEKVKSKEQIQKEKDEAERKALKAKYSHILSNTTMDNEKMCSRMAQEFPSASKDELNRVLNKILRLNCNISKLR